MTLARPQQKTWAAQTRTCGTTAARAWRHGASLISIATLAVFGLLGAAAPAGAIVLTGGPTTAPGGGWTCSAPAAGSEKLGSGGNYTCSGTAGAFTNLYIGVNKNTSVPFGDKMNSTGAADPSGNEVFAWAADGSTTIRYTGQTTIFDYGTVDTRVTLTFSGTGAVVSDATTQGLTGTNIRGAQGVHSLWRVGSSVSSLNVTVFIEASDTGTGAWQAADVYFDNGGHRRGDGSAEIDKSHVDLAFYTSSCGDGSLDGTEQCDTGIAGSICCNSNCTFNSGSVCRPSAGICDVQETCNGSSAACPGNGFQLSTLVCRPSTGVCDPAENCTGSAAACPGNTILPSTTVCRPSAGICDVAENCTGTTGPCPSDTFVS